MSKKDKVIDIPVVEESKEEKKVETFKFGVNPFLVITIVRENRAYRFEMPIGAHLDECMEACSECLEITKKMRDEGKKKIEEAEKEKKSESSTEDTLEDSQE